MRFVLPPLFLACAGCSMMKPSTAVVQPANDWRSVATEADAARLRGWRDTFTDAVAAARAAGHGAEIDAQGDLLKPDAAIGGPIPAGMYRCRVFKLGAQTAGLLDYVSYPWFACRVQQQGNLQRFAKLSGSQRQVGVIFPYDPLHGVFLGTVAFATEERAMPYGADPQRDVIGFVDRLGPRRWRLVMPKPAFESQMDVMELVPQG